MDLFKMFSISGNAMAAQRSRLSVITGNMANAETTRTPEGGPYRRRDVIFQAAPLKTEFSDLMAESFSDNPEEALSVQVMGIRQSNRPPRQIYDPSHPDANANGYVSLPDINVMEEMVDLLSAVRSYEANLTAFNATKSLVRRLLDLGRAP
jgi:flagellar basal-body rod protein FlgC